MSDEKVRRPRRKRTRVVGAAENAPAPDGGATPSTRAEPDDAPEASAATSSGPEPIVAAPGEGSGATAGAAASDGPAAPEEAAGAAAGPGSARPTHVDISVCLCAGLGPLLTQALRTLTVPEEVKRSVHDTELEALRLLRTLIEMRLSTLAPDDRRPAGPPRGVRLDVS